MTKQLSYTFVFSLDVLPRQNNIIADKEFHVFDDCEAIYIYSTVPSRILKFS